MELLWKLVVLLSLVEYLAGSGVLLRPMFTKQPGSVVFPLQPGGNHREVVFSCEAQGYPPPFYRWKLNDSFIQPRPGSRYSHVGGNLHISRLNKDEDVGIYQCLATNSFGTIMSREASLHVAYLENFKTQRRSPVRVREGQGVVLLCGPPPHSGELTFTWIFNEYPSFVVQDMRRFVSQKTGNLYIAKVEPSDVGNYTCVVTNTVTKTSVQGPPTPLVLRVDGAMGEYEPKIEVQFPEVVPVAKSSTVKLECFALGNPVPAISWRRLDGASFARKVDINKASGVLEIPYFQQEDAGIYECVAENSRGRNSVRGKLTFYAAPHLTEKPQDVQKTIDDTLVWECKASAKPKASYRWLKNGEPLDPMEELQFERLTRELEVERQIVANQLERCRVGAESPGAGSSSSSEKSLPWRTADASASGDSKSRVTDSSQSPCYRIRTESEQVSLYSPEQSSLHERSAGNSRSSTQMNSYSDSGYQDASSGCHSSQNLGKAELRLQHSFPGAGTGSLVRNSRAEGQASSQVTAALPGRAMRRGNSVPSRSPAYASSMSPSRGSLRTSAGSAYGSPIVTEPKPLSSIFSTTLPCAPRSSTTTAGSGSGSPFSAQVESPVALRRVGSANSRSGSAGRATLPYHASAGSSSARMGSPLTMVDNSPLTKQPAHSSSPVRASMTAVPQHYSSTLPRSMLHNSDPYGPQTYDIYERMTRPDSLTDALVDNVQGIRSSYASQHSQLGQDLRSAMSPDRHIAPIFEERTFQGPLYRSPGHNQQGSLYRSTSGVGSLQRTSSQRSAMTYQRNNYALSTAATYADPYRAAQYRPADPGYAHQAVVVDDGATRSPSIDSIQKDPREFAWRDPDLTEVIHMLQHHFPSVQANAAAYLQHLCYADNRIKAEVCRLGGIKHLVDLLDHKVLEVQRNACGALRNLAYGKAMDDNKRAVRNAGGIPALLRLLRKTVDAEVRELVTGVLWNLSSCDSVKMTIVRDALITLTNTVIIPHSGWSSTTFDDDHKLKFHSSLVLKNTTGCMRNLSSAGEEARKQMRTCEGLVDSLLYVIKACVNTSDFDSKIVENCICALRNLSYRLDLEMPPSQLIGGQEVDGLLGTESPSKEVDSGCWGRKKKKKKKSLQEDTWDGVGPIPGFSKSPKGAEMLWHPAVVKPYLTLLAESSNPATLEGSAGSLQNLSAGNWRFAAYIRAAVRKEKGLPILVELLRMDNERVVRSVAIALRNMALDVRNKELIGKYAMRDLVNRLPVGNTTQLSDDTMAAICCTLHEVTSKNMENAKALADTGGIEKLVNITKGKGDRYSMKVVKAAAQVLNTLWQYRDLRTIYKKDGWNQYHFLTPVSTLERDRFRSQPTLPSSAVPTSPVNHPAASATSSPAMLGIKEHRASIRDYQRAQSTMQFYNYQGDNSIHKNQYAGSGKPSTYYYSSPTREEPKRTQPMYYTDEPGRRNYDTYRMYLQHPHGYDDSYLDEVITYPPTVDYSSQPHGLKSATNYVDFYASTRRPSYRAEQYPGSPDSWV